MRGYAAKELPQFEQNREAGASTAAPHCAHAPFRYFPQEEQNTGSGSGRGPHVSHDRRIDRYRSTAASAWSTVPPPTSVRRNGRSGIGSRALSRYARQLGITLP